MRRISLLALALLGACNQPYHLDLPDVNLEPPDDLPQRLAAWRSRDEKWHGDPREVADVAIRRHLDVPWKAHPYDARDYTFLTNEEWGPHVVRGYVYPSGHEMRYRVKIRPYKEIWYPVQVSHFKIHDLPHPALEDEPRGQGH